MPGIGAVSALTFFTVDDLRRFAHSPSVACLPRGLRPRLTCLDELLLSARGALRRHPLVQ
ncbi:hypothetical protein [Bradyrhizobium retamae]|uniref:hypothetical protein n=1 Tax=Bradyrhizobium retamae TaxID=1300035 RepID=UPI003D31CB80